ncbi:hypothetical protein NJC38_01705 [Pseudomonas sp. 21LCFQ010]|uniref:hypothetical protein n=1 Tax=Pseudomonas sp. 21LCFQ010 TaxID=2957506 RepID=UPI002097B9C7|nr:hypothetical protein [Pseudomonas sp. 21LCFQ010]MCO8160867.1 hypothetical protein [Pseudomonas sp. 21LCFQ010]
MLMESVQNSVANVVRPGAMFEEMQREDFLALAAALRQFNVYQPLAAEREVTSCFDREPRLALIMES